MNLEKEETPQPMEVDYGYGRAVPDNGAPDYGYGDAAPDSATSTMIDYGYGHAAPDIKKPGTAVADYYGYGDACPDSAKNIDNQGTSTSCSSGSTSRQQRGGSPRGPRVGRRSSMKQAGRVGRRASIGYTGEMILQLPGQKEPVRRRTSISFDQYAEVAEVEPVSSLTDEPEKLWFQPEEYDAIHEKAGFIRDLAIAAVANDENINIDDSHRLCTRGLECHIYRDQVAEEQFMAKRSVLLEQEHQRRLGIFDDEIVAKIYQLTSMNSTMRATVLAQQDYAVAERHTRTTRDFLRRSSIC